ncbi:hydrolase [Luteolibacter sp. LG18]|nr:hydrolase [Luteolibacter sp. LG18]
MTDDFTLTFLGTGTSTGIPVIGCGCETCQSTDPRNVRTRSSILVQTPEVTLLVDSGPDLRQQALREKLRTVDAVLYTHGHLDHVTGFDDLRAFCWHREGALPMHATAECMATLRTMFAWAFSTANTYRGYVKPDPKLIEGPFFYGKLKVTPLPVQHASVETVGFLFEYPGFKSAAYFPDVKAFPPVTQTAILGIDVLILDALQPQPHATHFSNEEALAAIGEVKAREAWLTHLGHNNEHATLESTLPRHVKVAYDGLKLSLARSA